MTLYALLVSTIVVSKIFLMLNGGLLSQCVCLTSEAIDKIVLQQYRTFSYSSYIFVFILTISPVEKTIDFPPNKIGLQTF